MKSYLRNLISFPTRHFADSVKYTSNLGTAYATTSGVVGPTITVTANGFTATVSHTTTTKTCAVYVGARTSTRLNYKHITKSSAVLCSDKGRRRGKPRRFSFLGGNGGWPGV